MAELRQRAIASLTTLALVACGQPPARSAEPPLPQAGGMIAVAGLSAPAQIIRDRWGVPHITASSRDDLFLAQGFVQAQDRLFQMDLWRRSVQGRLAEVIGPNFIQRDLMTRRVQYRGEIDAEWAAYSSDLRPIAIAFTRGVNAWVSIARAQLPLAFQLAGWMPEFWRPEDLLNRTDAFVASGDAENELFRARLVAGVGAVRAERLLPLVRTSPAGPFRTPLLGSGLGSGVESWAVSSLVADGLRRVGARPFFSGFASPFPDRLSADPAPVPPSEALVVAPAAGSRSTAWAVAPVRTGAAPLLAASIHAPLDNPSEVYLVHLTAPGWNVAGATRPWLPGVLTGHNDHIAWSMTPAPADTQDVYVERLNPANPRQVEVSGRWVDMMVEKDSLLVKGRKEPFDFETLFTQNGLVIAIDSERHLAFTLRWAGTEPGMAAGLAATVLNRAESAEALRREFVRWRSPAVEFTFADRAGHIGRQVAGLMPRRVTSAGTLPQAGWAGRPAWNGWTAPEILEGVVDPRVGYVVAAGASSARLRRLEELLADQRPIDVDRSEQMQHDVVAWSARQLIPLLDRIHSEHREVEEARNRLLRWDRRITADSPDAALFVVWEARLHERLAERLPRELRAEYVARAGSVLHEALIHPTRLWFEGDVLVARDALVGSTLASAIDEVRQRAGASTDTRWGTFNRVTFAHPLAITARARSRFNIGPYTTSGYSDTPLSISGGREHAVGPALQLIVSLGDWDASVVSYGPGQSEWPGSPHFGDLAKLWAEGVYLPLVFSETAVGANAETTLRLGLSN